MLARRTSPPKRQQRLFERSLPTQDRVSGARPVGAAAARSSSSAAAAARLCAWARSTSPLACASAIGPLRPSVEVMNDLTSCSTLQRTHRQTRYLPGGVSPGTSASLGRPTHLQSRRSAAVDRQVGERPVDGLHRPDHPLGQVGDDHRGQLVNLAVKGQLAPT
jgi:hypothetical protein